MKKKIFTLVLPVMFFWVAVQAQQRTITGVVKDAQDSQPLAGINVQAKGTNITSTNK